MISFPAKNQYFKKLDSLQTTEGFGQIAKRQLTKWPTVAQHSTTSYDVVENMNRRTAEQGTAEYRSEKHCLICHIL